MVVLSRILKKSLACALFFLLAVGAVGVFPGKVEAQRRVDSVQCRFQLINQATEEILADSGAFQNEAEVEDVYLPFNTPITWRFEVYTEGQDLSCSNSNEGWYFQLHKNDLARDVAGNNPLTSEYYILENSTLGPTEDGGLCSVGGGGAFMHITRQFNHSIRENDVVLGVTNSLVEVVPISAMLRKSQTGPDVNICEFKVRPNLDLDRSIDSGRCTYTQACDVGGRVGTQICLGDQNADSPVCTWREGDTPTRSCSSCFVCGNGTCYPGCSHLVDQSNPMYEPACAELATRNPVCGDNVCEAGEGFCRDDCMGSDAFHLCEQIGDDQAYESCRKCSFDNNGIWTTFGCIPSTASGILETFIGIGLSIGGGVALLTIIAAAYIFSTSQGDPKKVGDAKDMMTSAIVGLLFIIFSITILQFIGVTVLQLPGFGS